MALNQAQLVNPPESGRTGGVKQGANITIAADGTISTSTPISAATLAQAAAGTLDTVYSSPLTSVPKDASGMTGAALLPSGTLGQRPVSGLVSGMTRFRTDASPASLETYDGSSWKQIAYNTIPPYAPTLPDLVWDFSDPAFQVPVYTVCRNLTIIDQPSPETKNFGGLYDPAPLSQSTVGSICTIIAYGDIYVGTSNELNLVPCSYPSRWNTTSSVLNEGGIGAGGAFGGPAGGPGIPQPWSSFGAGTGASGSHATTTTARAVSPQGGAGSSLFMVAYGNITFAANAEVNAEGGDTFNGSVLFYPFTTTGSGGGGGAGGNIVIQSFGTLSIDNTVIFRVPGGNGANGLNTDGTGGAFAGGGGGGGWVVLGGRGGYSYTPSSGPNISGGLAGTDTGSPATRGGSGGSNAGVGGKGGESTIAARNGEDGIALLNRFLLDVY